ncbi:MAG: 30S ribosomal protein S19 [Candidatus Aenigmatarchaeota archaeon]
MAKDFTFRGKTVEELRELDLTEFAELLDSRKRRSLLRGLTDAQKDLLEGVREGEDYVKTQARDMVILPEMVGTRIGVHNGKDFVDVEIEPEMIGHYLGEFAKTRKKVDHSAPGLGATRTSKHVPLK